MRVPTLPTPTTLCATSVTAKWSSKWRRSRLQRVAIFRYEWKRNSSEKQIDVDAHELVDWNDQGRSARDAPPSLHNGRHLSDRLPAVAAAGFGDTLFGHLEASLAPLPMPRRERRFHSCQDVVDVETCVPDVEDRSLGEVAHGCSVLLDGYERSLPTLLPRKVVVASRDHEARREPLDVPFERTGQRFVEVVDVEDQSPLRRRIRAEIRKVRVTTQLRA